MRVAAPLRLDCRWTAFPAQHPSMFAGVGGGVWGVSCCGRKPTRTTGSAVEIGSPVPVPGRYQVPILYCKTYCTENTIILSLVIGCSWFGEPILQILGMPKAGQSTMWQPCIPTFCKLYILEHVCELNKVQITEHLQTVHLNTLRKVFSRVYLGVLIWPL